MERAAGVEPAPAVWKTAVQPPALRPQGLPESSRLVVCANRQWARPGPIKPGCDRQQVPEAGTNGGAGRGSRTPRCCAVVNLTDSRDRSTVTHPTLSKGAVCDSRHRSPINNLYGATPGGCRSVLYPARESNSHAARTPEPKSGASTNSANGA